jgi:enoyl-CoA hydratase
MTVELEYSQKEREALPLQGFSPGCSCRQIKMNQISGDELIVERRGAVQWVLFNRPHHRNALTWAMYDGLIAVCGEVNSDRTIRAMVLAGAGLVFAAGTDIAQFRDFKTEKDAIDYEAHGNLVMGTLESVRTPVIAALAGACTGAGAAIASCCDLRIAAPSTRFGVPIARTLGNCLSHQNYARLVALLGFSRAREILITGRLMDAEELRAAGGVAEVVAEELLFDRAQELAESVAANAPLTLQATKQAVTRIRDRLFPVEDDADVIRMCYMSQDFREGIESFLAKRNPVWRGE